MKSSVRFGAAGLMAAVLGLGAPQAQAEFIVDITQSGPNVVMTGSGSLDLAGLSPDGHNTVSSGLIPNLGQIGLGPTGASSTEDFYTGFTGPSSFGSGSETLADSGTGNQVALLENINDLLVPTGYVSGSPLSDTTTFDGTTIAGLGLTPGTYTYMWGATAPVDSFVINIVGVPEPLTLSFFGAGLLGAAAMRRRKAK